MTTAANEWRRYPLLPIAAALGYATSVIYIYGIGPYVVPITREFGWSRAEFAFGGTIAVVVQALFSVPLGLLVDRVGSRRLGLAGLLLVGALFALLGTASGGAVNWLTLWLLLAFAALPVQATIWASAVTSRFSASRGMALAVMLCGASVAQFGFPPLATKLIAAYGWRLAFVLHAAAWVCIAFPFIFLFFRGAKDVRVTGERPAALSGLSFREGLRSSIYMRLMATSLFLTLGMVALVWHFIPMLTGAGLPAGTAAWIASMIGISSIVGRLVTGFLLDRFSASRVGAVVYLLPLMASLTLLIGGIDSTNAKIAAVLIGLTLGSEIDVIVYLVTRHFGLRSFGALYGGLLITLSMGTAFGPLAAAHIFDRYGSYSPYLWAVVALMGVSSLAMLSLPKPAFASGE